ncbi:MAG: carboxypeptidase-like regulatory domain-containing protein [Ignavibacteriales bacterium]|nr:carboxypeptidase-like regulatory domain-containing protein [Ignavibacteriales bacterium]
MIKLTAANARIELSSNTSGRYVYDTCDSLGNFFFDSLYKDNYTLTFRSTSYDIYTSYVSVSVDEDQDIIQDGILLRYNMLDDFSTKIISDSVFFIKMQPDGAKIGNNYDLINILSGYYRSGGFRFNVVEHKCIYLVPEGVNWNDPGIDLTPTYIQSNFQFLFSVNEEPVVNGRHEIKISDSNNIQSMFSNPSNGFAFVLNDTTANEIKIPCVDFSNNDFGLKIFYVEISNN